MLRITKVTDYGIEVLARMARENTQSSAADLAEAASLPLPIVSKVLKILGREGVLLSHRGIKGGYTLSAPAEEITVSEVIGALEGPIAMTECTVFGDVECDHEDDCPVRANWQIINQAVSKALSGITLADMMRPSLGGNGAENGDAAHLLNVLSMDEERV